MGDVSDIGELLTAHRVKAAKRAGWAKTFAVALVAAVGQFYQIHKADAEKSISALTDTERLIKIELTLDMMRNEIHYLSERTTSLESEGRLRRP